MTISIEQKSLQFILAILPDRARYNIEEFANYTTLQFVRLFVKVTKDRPIVVVRGVEMSIKELAEEFIGFTKYNLPLEQQEKEYLHTFKYISNLAGTYTATAGIAGLLSNRVVAPVMLLGIGWVLLAPSLVQHKRLATLIEKDLKNELSWTYTLNKFVFFSTTPVRKFQNKCTIC